jgi:serine/threonine protein kinase
MATVYKAYDTRLEREIAIKDIRTENILPSALKHTLKRFEREARSLAKLSHPNIVSVIEYGEHDSVPFLVMQYIPAGTLKSKLGRPILWHDALSMLIPISKALVYSHSQGIIHRDVKPSNILLTLSGELMLTDFGIAKLLENDEGHTLSTGTGVGIGTPEYMAPEQGMGKDVDARADIYSLGIILYEMLTGRKPFTADTPMAVIVKHIHDPLPRAKKYIPDLPDPVERILLKSLAKEPDDRYQDMGSLGRAMDEIVHSHKKKVARTKQRKDRTQSRVTFFKSALRSFVSKLASLKHIRPSPLQVRFAGLSMASILVIAGMVWFARQPAFEAILHPPTQVVPSASPIPPSTFTPTLTFTATPNPTSTPDVRRDARIAKIYGKNIYIYDGLSKLIEKIDVSSSNLEINSWEEPSWSPDGEKLVMSTGDDSRTSHILYIFDLPTRGFSQLTDVGYNSLFPSWSPDGKFIVYHRNCSIYIISPDKQTNRQVGSGNSDSRCANLFRWSPDSKIIAWAALNNTSEKFEGIGMIDIETNQSYYLKYNFSQLQEMAWYPDGSNLIILNGSSLLIFSINGDSIERQYPSDELIPETERRLNPSWRPCYFPQWQIDQ